MRLTHAGLSVHAAQQQALARLYAMVQPKLEFSLTSMCTGCWQWSQTMFVASFLLGKETSRVPKEEMFRFTRVYVNGCFCKSEAARAAAAAVSNLFDSVFHRLEGHQASSC